jgi:hypothetical protein
MFLKLKRIYQILLYALMLCVGGWLFYAPLRAPLPAPAEAPHLLAAAIDAEHLSLPALPQGAQAKLVPFHRCASAFVQFISEEHLSGYRIRTYRLFPATLSVFFLLLLPALGLKRRGGCFESEDTPFWVALFTLATPPFLCYGSLFSPLSFQALLFLILLVAFRSYVIWPGILSTFVIAFVTILGLTISGNILWVLLLMLPAIGVGVGWSRIKLYWRWSHVATFTTLFLTALLCGWHFGFIQTPSLPTTWPSLDTLVDVTLSRLVWLTAGGFGLVAWVGLVLWCLYHPDKGWTKVFTLMYPLFFLASFGFEGGGEFNVPMICLSLILLGMALAKLPSLRIRCVVGGSALLALAVAMPRFINNHFIQTPADDQRQIAHALMKACKTPQAWRKVAFEIEDPTLYATLLWPIRQCYLLPAHQAYQAEVLVSDHPLTQLQQRRPSSTLQPLVLSKSTTLHLIQIPPSKP